jgi:hypothetical protein
MGIPVNAHQRMAFDTLCPNSLVLNRNDGLGERVMQVLSSYVFCSVNQPLTNSLVLNRNDGLGERVMQVLS